MEPEPSLNKELLFLAASDIDTRETSGSGNTAVVLKWLRGAGITWGGDEIPWCAAWMHDLVGRIQEAPRPKSQRASARSWASIGTAVRREDALPGDIVVFERGRGGHVGLFLRDFGKTVVVYGGNQKNRVWPEHYSYPIIAIRRLYRTK